MRSVIQAKSFSLRPQLAQVVVAVRIETGADEDHLRLELLQPRHPAGLDQLAHVHALGVGRHRQVEHVRRRMVGAAVRIERVLEDADHQHARVVAAGCLRCRCRGARRSRRWPRAPGRAARCAWRAAIATLLKKQKPIALSRQAWWPGGRTAQKALSSSPAITASVAAMAAPAARRAASTVKRVQRGVGVDLRMVAGRRPAHLSTSRWLSASRCSTCVDAVRRAMICGSVASGTSRAVQRVADAGGEQPVFDGVEPLRGTRDGPGPSRASSSRGV